MTRVHTRSSKTVADEAGDFWQRVWGEEYLSSLHRNVEGSKMF